MACRNNLTFFSFVQHAHHRQTQPPHQLQSHPPRVAQPVWAPQHLEFQQELQATHAETHPTQCPGLACYAPAEQSPLCESHFLLVSYMLSNCESKHRVLPISYITSHPSTRVCQHSQFLPKLEEVIMRTILRRACWKELLCRIISQLGPNVFKGSCNLSTLGDLAGLSSLQIVDFTASGLTGSIPASWATASFANTLQSLTLSQNPNVTGPLPNLAKWVDCSSTLGFVTLSLCHMIVTMLRARELLNESTPQACPKICLVKQPIVDFKMSSNSDGAELGMFCFDHKASHVCTVFSIDLQSQNFLSC